MHPRQAALLANAAELTDKLAAKKQTQQKQVAAVPSQFYEYTDPETGESFYLPKKLTTVRSPYTGKSMTGQKPTPIKPGQFGAELKEQKDKAKDKDKKASDQSWKA